MPVYVIGTEKRMGESRRKRVVDGSSRCGTAWAGLVGPVVRGPFSVVRLSDQTLVAILERLGL